MPWPGPIPELLTDKQLSRLAPEDLAQIRARLEHPGVCWDNEERNVMLALLREVESLREFAEAFKAWWLCDSYPLSFELQEQLRTKAELAGVL